MNFSNIAKKYFKLFFAISLIITLVASTNLIDTQNNLTNDKSSKEGFDIQIQSKPDPRKADVYYKDTAGEARDVYVEGNYAYIADYSSGLAIIDISDPTNPGTPVYENTAGIGLGVFVEGNYAYIADGGSGLAIMDLSDPTSPGTPIYENTAGYAYGIYVEGNYAYAATGSSGLAIIDISDPTNPGTPVYVNTAGTAYGVYVDGNYAYVADGTSGLAVIDISDPTNPGTPVYEDTAGTAYNIYVDGNYAYITAGSSGLAIIDISDPTNPGTPVYKDTIGPEAKDIFVSGNYAYIADRTSGLAIIDISDPSNPGTPVYVNTAGTAYGVYVDGNYAYVADGTSGLAVIKISEEINPMAPVYEDTAGYARGVYVEGNYAYIADYTSGLAIIDISDPTNPGTPVYEDTTESAYDVFVSGNYAYIADYDGLAVIDISDPTNPGTPVYADTTGTALGVYISGDYAYVASGTFGLAIIDISDPTNPGTPVYEDTTSSAYDVYVSGDYAFLACWTSGLAVIDISDPTNPGTPVYENTTGLAQGVYVKGNYAYVADGSSGLAIIDISDPTSPGTPVYENTLGNALSVYVSGNYAYVADGLRGLAIIDISDPANPGTPVYEDTADYAYCVYVEGNYAYVADESSGLAVIQVRQRVDMTNPVLTNTPSDITVTTDYTSQSLSWTATDLRPDIYTIELQGTGIVTGPISWTSGVAIVYNIPDGFDIGDYVYTVTFTDEGDNSITNSVIFTVIDTTDPTITDAPSDITVATDYTGQSLAWTATDLNPSTYTIELQGTGTVVSSTSWSSGVAITYNIPDGFSLGNYLYTVTFADTSGNSITESVLFTVGDTINPIITNTPSDITVEADYSGQSISWTATDLNPGIYLIELQGTGYVVGSTAWSSGVAITYNIPDGFALGDYIYTVRFVDDVGRSITDTVTFTVGDTIDPTLTDTPSDFSVESDYSGQSISWTATDLDPNTYTIELQGTGVVAGPTAWSSGVAVTYNIMTGLTAGDYIFTVTFTDTSGNSITDSVTFTVGDTVNPTITNTPSDITVATDYTSQSVSWTATDLNPDTYTIELQGTGIVVSSTAWTSGVAISYNIPDGLALGSYIYTVTFTDAGGNSITDSVTFTVSDTNNPTITDTPSDITVASDYTGESISWTATDLNPDTYTIELQGTGTVVSSTAWTSGVAISYNIPDGLALGSYIYTVTFTDTSGNSITESVTFTVIDTNSPTITDFPSDITVEIDYTGQSISWTATDLDPNTYTIELQGIGIVVTSTAWTSGVAITFNIPDGLALGSYVYTVTFTDDGGNSITDSVTFTVVDTINPIITNTPSDITVESYYYTGQSISWTATDLNPGTYTIELQGTGTVVSSTAWTSGVEITFDIPDGLAVGDYVYIVTFTDSSGNSITDSVTFTVSDTINPVITNTPSDLTVASDYSGESLSWTATDLNPSTYTIELQGIGIVVTSTAWTSGVAITYNIPDGLAVGTYIYTVSFMDDGGNSITDSVTFAVSDTINPIITNTPSDFTVEFYYSEQNVSWTATDLNPSTYTIELQGVGTVAGPTVWTSGVSIYYDIPDGLAAGDYIYIITFTDEGGNTITDSVTFAVNDEVVVGEVNGSNQLVGLVAITTIVAVISTVRVKRRKY